MDQGEMRRTVTISQLFYPVDGEQPEGHYLRSLDESLEAFRSAAIGIPSDTTGLIDGDVYVNLCHALGAGYITRTVSLQVNFEMAANFQAMPDEEVITSQAGEPAPVTSSVKTDKGIDWKPSPPSIPCSNLLH